MTRRAGALSTPSCSGRARARWRATALAFPLEAQPLHRRRRDLRRALLDRRACAPTHSAASTRACTSRGCAASCASASATDLSARTMRLASGRRSARARCARFCPVAMAFRRASASRGSLRGAPRAGRAHVSSTATARGSSAFGPERAQRSRSVYVELAARRPVGRATARSTSSCRAPAPGRSARPRLWRRLRPHSVPASDQWPPARRGSGASRPATGRAATLQQRRLLAQRALRTSARSPSWYAAKPTAKSDCATSRVRLASAPGRWPTRGGSTASARSAWAPRSSLRPDMRLRGESARSVSVSAARRGVVSRAPPSPAGPRPCGSWRARPGVSPRLLANMPPCTSATRL